MKKTAVLIPCYNESVTIEKVVKEYKAALPEAEIYVYDNNSTDHTEKLQEQQELLLNMNTVREKEM